MKNEKNLCRRLTALLLCLVMLLPLTACGETKMAQKQVFAMVCPLRRALSYQ